VRRGGGPFQLRRAGDWRPLTDGTVKKSKTRNQTPRRGVRKPLGDPLRSLPGRLARPSSGAFLPVFAKWDFFTNPDVRGSQRRGAGREPVAGALGLGRGGAGREPGGCASGLGRVAAVSPSVALRDWSGGLPRARRWRSGTGDWAAASSRLAARRANGTPCQSRIAARGTLRGGGPFQLRRAGDGRPLTDVRGSQRRGCREPVGCASGLGRGAAACPSLALWDWRLGRGFISFGGPQGQWDSLPVAVRSARGCGCAARGRSVPVKTRGRRAPAY
jgi:hypothetical protein